MSRLELLRVAKREAYELVDLSAALSDAEYAELRKCGDKAIRRLAIDLLRAALEDAIQEGEDD